MSYGVGVGVAASHDLADQGGWMLARAIGPFVYLGRREGCSDDSPELEGAACGFGETMLSIVVVVGGLVQIAGAAMLTASLVMMEDRVAPDRETVAQSDLELDVLPVPTPGGGGVAVVGRF